MDSPQWPGRGTAPGSPRGCPGAQPRWRRRAGRRRRGRRAWGPDGASRCASWPAGRR